MTTSTAIDIDHLYRLHHRMVHRRATRLVGTERAPDLVQVVFERALRYVDSFQQNSSPVTWLYQITTRVCLNYLRDRQNRDRLLELWGAPAWSRPSVLTDPETRFFLNQAWRQLDEPLVEIGTYHFIDGLSQSEIADLLGCSRKTVGNRLQNLRTHIRGAAELPEEHP